MSVQFFAPKTLGSAAIGIGALGGGGTIYWYQVPTTWRELLIKEGYSFLKGEYDYKGMFADQKDSDDWKNDNDLKTAKETDVHSKATQYCNKLDDKLPDSTGSDYENKKRKFIAFCTYDGIKTVKSRIVQSKQKSLSWIADSAADKWKAVFAVYRYETEFIAWLKADDAQNNNDLNSETNVDQYTKLETACKKLLKKNHRDVSDDQIKYGSWWCVELGYTTIKQKIQKTDSNWKEREQTDSSWGTLKTKWEHTDIVKKWANKANGEQDEQKELTEESLKKLCESTNVSSQLSDNDSYQEKYRVIMSVCKKES